MPRAENEQTRSKASPVTNVASDDLPPVVPPRKHPWRLLLAALLMAAWLAFLAFMAMRG